MIKKQYKKIIAFVLLLIMTLTLTGCGNDSSPVYTIEGVDVPVSLYLQLQQNVYGGAIERVINDEKANSPDGKVDEITIQYNILDYSIDDEPVSAWIRAETLKIVKNYVAIELEFERLKLSIPEEEIEKIKEEVAVEYAKSDKYFNYMGITKETFENTQISNVKAEEVYNYYYTNEDSDKKIPKEETLEFLNEKYAKAVLFPVTLSKIDEDKRQDVINELKELAEDLSKGADFQEKITEFTKKYDLYQSDDEDKPREHTLDTYTLLVAKDSKQIPEATTASIWSMTKYNEYIYLETDGIAQIVARREQGKEDAETYYKELAAGMRAEEFQEELNTVSDGYEVITNNNVYNKYSPKRLSKRLKKAMELYGQAQ